MRPHAAAGAVPVSAVRTFTAVAAPLLAGGLLGACIRLLERAL